MAADGVIELIIKATNQTANALRAPIHDLEDLKGAIAGASKLWAVMGTAAFAAVTLLGKEAIEFGGHVNVMTQNLGMSAEGYSAFAFAGQQAGLEVENVDKGLRKFNITAEAALDSNSKQAAMFKLLGVSVTDANGKMKPMEALLMEVADAFKKLPDGAAKATIATDLFGAKNVNMIAVLNQGSAGLKELAAKADSLGAIISGNTAEAMHEFENSMKDIHIGARGLVSEGLAPMLPGLQVMADTFIELISKGGELNGIFMVIAGALKFIAQIVETIIVGFEAAVRVVFEGIASLAAAALALISGNFKGAVEVVRTSMDQMGDLVDKSNQRLTKIWSDPASKPKLDVPGYKKDLDQMLQDATKSGEVRKKAEAEAVAFSKAMHEQEMESYKKASLGEIQAALAVLNAKKTKNLQDLNDIKKLEADKQTIVDQMERERISKIEQGGRQEIQNRLMVIQAINDANQGLNAKEYAERVTLENKLAELDKQASSQRVSVMNKLFSTLQSLSNSHNKTMVAIAKAANIAHAIMDVSVSVVEAFKSFPYPYNFVVGGIMAAAGAAQVANIASQGFEYGGMIPGSSSTGDRQLVAANAGELILNRAQQTSIAAQLSGSGNAGGQTTVYMDSKPLFQFISDAFRDGRLTIPQYAIRGA